MLEQGKKMLAKVMILYALVVQVFAFTNVGATVAQVPVKDEPKKDKKERKQSKAAIIKNMQNKLSLYKKIAAAHGAAIKSAEFKAKVYLARLQKAKTANGRNKLIKARIKAIESINSHKKSFDLYVHKASVTSEKLLNLKPAKAVLVGRASWYGAAFAGRRTSNGERFNPRALTAAMRGFRGHKVKVVNMTNKKSVVVKVNDHGPARWTGRVIDLSQASFSKIASTRQGVISKVKIYVY